MLYLSLSWNILERQKKDCPSLLSSQGDKLEVVLLALSLFKKEIAFKFPFRHSLILGESQKSLPSRNNRRGKVSLRKDCLFSFKVNLCFCFLPAMKNG